MARKIARSALFGVLVACATSSARADVALQGPEGCADVSILRARIEALLPRGIAFPTAVVVVEPSSLGLRATIRVAGAGPRSIEGASCEPLLEAVALVLAMGAKGPSEAAKEPPPVAATEAPPPVLAPPPLRLAVILGAEGAGAAGPLPNLTVGGAGVLGLDYGAFRAEAHGAFYAGQHADAPRPTGGRIDLGLASLGASACVGFALGAGVRLGPCAAAGMLVFSAVGQDVGNATSDGTVAFTVEGGALLVVPIHGAFSVRARAMGGFVPSTNAFAVEPVGTVYEASHSLVRAGIGVEVRL